MIASRSNSIAGSFDEDIHHHHHHHQSYLQQHLNPNNSNSNNQQRRRQLTTVDSAISLHSAMSSSGMPTSPTSPTIGMISRKPSLAPSFGSSFLEFAPASPLGTSPSGQPHHTYGLRSPASATTLKEAAGLSTTPMVDPKATNDPMVLHSLQELHDTLITLVESGMRREQAWKSGGSQPITPVSPRSAPIPIVGGDAFPLRPANPDLLPSPASAFSYSFDSIMEEIDTSLNEMHELEAASPSSLNSPIKSALATGRPPVPRQPGSLHKRSVSFSSLDASRPPLPQQPPTAPAAAPVEPTPSPPQLLTRQLIDPKTLEEAATTPLRVLTATPGTYFGHVERLLPRRRRDDPLRFERALLLVDSVRLHVFQADPAPNAVPEETVFLTAGEACQVANSGRGLFVLRMSVADRDGAGVVRRWVFRAFSDDEAEAWSAIIGNGCKMARAQRVAAKAAFAAGTFAHPQPPPPPAAALPPVPPGPALKRSHPGHAAGASAPPGHTRTLSGGSTTGPMHPTPNDPPSPRRRHRANTDQLPLPNFQQPPHNLPPTQIRERKSSLATPASHVDLPAPVPLHPHPSSSYQGHSFDSNTDDPDVGLGGYMLSPPNSSTTTRGHSPGVFRSRRLSDSELSYVSSDAGAVSAFNFQSWFKPTSRTKPSSSSKPVPAAIDTTDADSVRSDRSDASNGTAGSGGSFSIRKVLGISSGAAPGGATHVYLVRGGARQPGTAGGSRPGHTRTLSNGGSDDASASASATRRGSFQSDHSASSTTGSVRVVAARSGSEAQGAVVSAPQVVVLAQFPEIPAAKPAAPPKAAAAKVFMVRGGSRFRAAPDPGKLVKITVPANPAVREAVEGAGGVAPVSPPASPPTEAKVRKVFMVRGGTAPMQKA
ncbi:hypothetical protein HDU96_002512 [Phlyctochytrium bullatum]|nr:hypothetical protein HDU96_002512 [Phlyctochytrium bullatum]